MENKQAISLKRSRKKENKQKKNCQYKELYMRSRHTSMSHVINTKHITLDYSINPL